MSARGFAIGALLLLAAGALVSVLTLGSSTPPSLEGSPEETRPVGETSSTAPQPAPRARPTDPEAEPLPSRREERPPTVVPEGGTEAGPPPIPGEVFGRVLDP
ncbi:MAG: hypothetical protein ACREIU_01425, partial [Planctomycetota bacterium]